MRRHSQTRVDSFMESVVNTTIGFVLSFVVWGLVAWMYGIPMPWRTNLQITGIFTIVSVSRQYIIRRVFDGRTPWLAIKGVFVREQ